MVGDPARIVGVGESGGNLRHRAEYRHVAGAPHDLHAAPLQPPRRVSAAGRGNGNRITADKLKCRALRKRITAEAAHIPTGDEELGAGDFRDA